MGRLIHPHTSVTDAQQDIRTNPGPRVVVDKGLVELNGPRLNREPAALGHRIPGIDHQIRNNLLELPRIRLDGPECGAGVDDQVDVLGDEPLLPL